MSMMTAMVRRYLQLLLFAGATIVATWPQVAPAHHRFSQEQCALLESKIDALQSLLRQGYSAKQGRRYRERMRELELERHRKC